MTIELALTVLKAWFTRTGTGSKPHRDVRPTQTPEWHRNTYTPKATRKVLPPSSDARRTRVITGSTPPHLDPRQQGFGTTTKPINLFKL